MLIPPSTQHPSLVSLGDCRPRHGHPLGFADVVRKRAATPVKTCRERLPKNQVPRSPKPVRPRKKATAKPATKKAATKKTPQESPRQKDGGQEGHHKEICCEESGGQEVTRQEIGQEDSKKDCKEDRQEVNQEVMLS